MLASQATVKPKSSFSSSDSSTKESSSHSGNKSSTSLGSFKIPKMKKPEVESTTATTQRLRSPGSPGTAIKMPASSAPARAATVPDASLRSKGSLSSSSPATFCPVIDIVIIVRRRHKRATPSVTWAATQQPKDRPHARDADLPACGRPSLSERLPGLGTTIHQSAGNPLPVPFLLPVL